MTSGKQENLKKALLRTFGKDEIGTVSCLGHCHSATAVMIDQSTCSFEDPDKSEIIISHCNQAPSQPFFVGTNVEKPVFIPEFTVI